jgi:hypothetical protein
MTETTNIIGSQLNCGDKSDVYAESVIDNPVLPCSIPRGNVAHSCKGSLRLKRANGGCREILAYRHVGYDCPDVRVANKSNCPECCKKNISTPFCVDGCVITYYSIETQRIITFSEDKFIGFFCLDEMELAPPCTPQTDGYDYDTPSELYVGELGGNVNLFNSFELWYPQCCDLVIRLKHFIEGTPTPIPGLVGSSAPIVYSYIRLPKVCTVVGEYVKGYDTCLAHYYRSVEWPFLFDDITITHASNAANCDTSKIVYNLLNNLP